MAKLIFGGILLMLAAASVFGNEYKTEFAEKFEAGLHDYLKDFYLYVCDVDMKVLETLLKEVKPDSKYVPKIQEYLKAYTTFKDKLEGPKLSSEQFVQDILDAREYMELDELVDSLEGEDVSISADSLKSDLYKKKKDEISDKTAQLWFDLYKNVPTDELSKYKEYNEINEMFKEVSASENHKAIHLDDALEHSIEFLDIKHWDKLW